MKRILIEIIISIIMIIFSIISFYVANSERKKRQKTDAALDDLKKTSELKVKFDEDIKKIEKETEKKIKDVLLSSDSVDAAASVFMRN